jgi:hypothetical protein
VTCAARGADLAYPSGAPDVIPGFCSVVAFGGKLVQFLSFLLVLNWYNHSISQHTTFSIDETL